MLDEAARAIVQRHAVQVSDTDYYLEQVAETLFVPEVAGGEEGGEEGEGAPYYLFFIRHAGWLVGEWLGGWMDGV